MQPSPGSAGQHSQDSRFPATRWSLVAAAAVASDDSGRAALAALCERYWYPLYTFARRQGCDPERAADLTQDCFLRILSDDALTRADPARGRFRSFLLGIMKHVLADRDRRESARCRDHHLTFSLDALSAEARFALEPAAADAPDAAYDRAWAQALVARAVSHLEREWACGETERRRFALLKPFLLHGRDGGHLLRAADQLGMSEAAARSLVHRLRQRFAAQLRAEVSLTVPCDADVDDELRCLLGALAS